MPQPIDPQTEIGRATAAERIQQIADRSSLAAQARATEASANTLRDMETQVQQAKARSDEVDQDLRRRNPFVGRRKKRGQGEPDSQGGQNKQARHFYNASEKDVTADDPNDHEFDVEI